MFVVVFLQCLRENGPQMTSKFLAESCRVEWNWRTVALYV